MAKKRNYVRIQLFPYSENTSGPGRSVTPDSTNDRFYFKPVEINVKVGGLIKLGRRVERLRPKLGPQGACVSTLDNREGTAISSTAPDANQASTPTNIHTGTGASLIGAHKSSTPENTDFAHLSHKNNNAVISREEAEYRADDLIISVIRNQIKMGFEAKGPLGEVAARTLDYGAEVGIESRAANNIDGHDGSVDNMASSDAFKIPVLFIAFRSKVVSRSHAEIWVGLNSRIYFRDNGSSSGTFLNQMRLSPSGERSRPHVINSGDIIQLGVDYQNNQREIFRCVVMKFIVSTNVLIRSRENNEKLGMAIRQLTAAMNPNAPGNTSNGGEAASDCCICLGRMVLMQALFLASCSHIFHYRCVVPLLKGGIMFLCPLCRQATNLDSRCSDASSIVESDDEECESSRDELNSQTQAKRQDSRDNILLEGSSTKHKNSFPNADTSLKSSKIPVQSTASTPQDSLQSQDDIPANSKHSSDAKTSAQGSRLPSLPSTFDPSQPRQPIQCIDDKPSETYMENLDNVRSEEQLSPSREHATRNSTSQGSSSNRRLHPNTSAQIPSETQQHVGDPRLTMLPHVNYFPYAQLHPQRFCADQIFFRHPYIPYPSCCSLRDYNTAIDRGSYTVQSPTMTPLSNEVPQTGYVEYIRDTEEEELSSRRRNNSTPLQTRSSCPSRSENSRHKKSSSSVPSPIKNYPHVKDTDAGATLKSRDPRVRANIPYRSGAAYGNMLTRGGYVRNSAALDEHMYPHPRHPSHTHHYSLIPRRGSRSVSRETPDHVLGRHYDFNDPDFEHHHFGPLPLYPNLFYPEELLYHNEFTPSFRVPSRCYHHDQTGIRQYYGLYEPDRQYYANHPEDGGFFTPDETPVRQTKSTSAGGAKRYFSSYNPVVEEDDNHSPIGISSTRRIPAFSEDVGGFHHRRQRKFSATIAGPNARLSLAYPPLTSDIEIKKSKSLGAVSELQSHPRKSPGTKVDDSHSRNMSNIPDYSTSTSNSNNHGDASSNATTTDTCSSDGSNSHSPAEGVPQ